MYTNWRPTLSPRTIRLLYQFGYIASGTACGLATLCLEEQRRRIQVLQRIADSAKVIRHHQRHRHNVALALDGGDDVEGGGGPVLDKQYTTRRRRQRDISGASDSDGQHSVQPSVLEEHGERSGHERSATQVEEISYLPQEASRNTGNPTTEPHGSMDGHASFRSFFNESKEDRRINGAFQRAHERERAANGGLYQPFKLRSPSLIKSVLSHRKAQPPLHISDENAHLSLFHTKKVWDEHQLGVVQNGNSTVQAPLIKIDPKDLSDDIQFFLHESIWEYPLEWNIFVTNKLLPLALQFGSLEEIRSLCHWRLSQHIFSEKDMTELSNLCDHLGDRFDRQQLLDLYLEVFDTKSRGLNPGVKPEHGLKIIGRAFHWEISVDSNTLSRTFLEPSVSGVEPEIVVHALEKETKDLLDRGWVPAAVRLVLLASETRIHQVLLVSLVDQVLDAAFENGQFSDCGALLRCKSKLVKPERLLPYCDPLIRACGDWKAYGLIVDLFCRKTGLGIPLSRLIKAISTSSRAILSIACSTDASLHQTFELIHRTIPKSQRSSVDESSAILTLKATWKATRNLKDIDAQILQLTERLKQNCSDGSLRRLDESVLEIYISANKLDRALATIARIHKTHEVSTFVMCQTGLLLAKQGHWDMLARLLEYMRKSKSVLFGSEETRVFNALIHFYAKRHSPTETWEFVESAIRDLRFSPNLATTETVLKSFVSKKNVNLIPKWVEFLKSVGYSVSVDGRMATSLLRQFHYENRPSHIYMIWFCRHLIQAAPLVAGEDLTHLVKQTIAYDIRKSHGKDQHLAEMRMKRLEGSKDFIPSHGLRWTSQDGGRRDQLYFHDSGPESLLSETKIRENGNDSPPSAARSVGSEEEPVVPLQILEDVPYETPSELGGNVENLPWNELDKYERGLALDDDSEATQLDSQTTVEVLREHDEDLHLRDVQTPPEYVLDKVGRKKLEGEMMIRLSFRNYQEVLDQYHASLDAEGLPASPKILEIAVEASLRLHEGDRSHADEIMSKAGDAGMNVTCALGPILLHQVSRETLSGIDANKLRRNVIAYYQMNEENGWYVNHGVGNHVSNILIANGFVQDGLDILSTIYMSHWAKDGTLDIVAMKCFLKGYQAIQSVDGIGWVVRTVLDQDMKIDQRFILQLRYMCRGDFKRMNRHSPETWQLLASWVDLCFERRERQMEDAVELGWDLVSNIAKCTADGSNASIDVSGGSGEISILKTARDATTGDGLPASVDALTESERLAKLKKRITVDITAEQVWRKRLSAKLYLRRAQDGLVASLAWRDGEEEVWRQRVRRAEKRLAWAQHDEREHQRLWHEDPHEAAFESTAEEWSRHSGAMRDEDVARFTPFA